MFTGIIEHVGTILAVRATPAGTRLRIQLGPLAEGMAPGASVAVDGACLTVAEVTDGWAEFDVVPETLARTTLGTLRPNDRVNLERPLPANGRLDGHFVQGHVDTTATLLDSRRSEADVRLRFSLDEPEVARYLVPKGSVAVSGVSLTVVDVQGQRFSVALVPTTLAKTTLAKLEVGGKVNVETDLLAKIVVHYLESSGAGRGPEKPPLTFDQLREAGWL